MIVDFETYLASLCTSSVLLIPPLGDRSTLRQLSSCIGSIRGCNNKNLVVNGNMTRIVNTLEEKY